MDKQIQITAVCPHCFIRMGIAKLKKHREVCHMNTKRKNKDGHLDD